MTTLSETRSLSIAQWKALAQAGAVLPLCIRLDGNSMWPLIRQSKDQVTVVPLTRPLKQGDVVLIETPQAHYVVHRVRRLTEGGIQTLGDHCWKTDPWMPDTAVIGLVNRVNRGTLTIPLDCRLMRWLGRAWMIGMPIRRHYLGLRVLMGHALRRMGWKR